ncbi:biofilm PGA synthesis N-glycosyltransferase PgaC [Solilutibacter tolerans]|uniref:Biofilm PGA synthesis N-glycosyltransferase PgaC n=2 Tax=Solilutibacter tolerans TaxID=1604334 RepID=A0A1N6X5X6_9GAMM|nr:biofilm PGA synthesis N-glycosyltransferase PgaC [Lysobacter tolerans]
MRHARVLQPNEKDFSAPVAINEDDGHRRFYLSVPAKFLISLLVAVAWTMLSVYLSVPWLDELSQVIGRGFAVALILFIAYVPGFMNAFLISTILLDRRPARQRPASFPPVSILVACYNEANNIADTLTSLSRQDYPGDYEVLLLNDGSTDDTVAIAKDTIANLSNHNPRARFKIVDYPQNAGKAAVLNRGLDLASHDLVVTVDGDSWLYLTALRRIVERKLSDPPNTLAVAGAVLVRNSRTNWITRVQEWDYFHGIAAVKRMQSMYHGTLVAQGAFSLYEKQALKEVGGWPECVGEDIVVSWALLERGARIGYAEDAMLFTHVPEKLKQFALQRKRWSRGLMEAFNHHWRLLFKRRMTTLFIWWNLLFLPLDLVFTFAFIPGIVMALFGIYYIVGIMTIAVLPLAFFWNAIIYRVQKKMLTKQGLRVRRNPIGLFSYVVIYSLVLQPVCVGGYIAELIGLRKHWDTK